MTGHAPPDGRRPIATEVATGRDTSGRADLKGIIRQPSDNVINLPVIDERRGEQLQLALDGVPLAIGFAAGTVHVLLEAYYPRRVAQRRLEELRAEWHRVVDDAIRWALEEGRAS